MPGAGADPSRSEPESAPGPWRPGAGAAQKSGGSATLLGGHCGLTVNCNLTLINMAVAIYGSHFFFTFLCLNFRESWIKPRSTALHLSKSQSLVAI